MKKYIVAILVLLTLFLSACGKTQQDEDNNEKPITSSCRDNPLSDSCYRPSGDLSHESTIREEELVFENFENERINQKPRNWLIYSNPEYQAGSVSATVVSQDDNKFVKLYSDGSAKPPYPQGAASPTLIFTTKFNLDESQKGLMKIDVMMPEEENNIMSFGVSAGAVNVISFTVDKDYKLSAKVGGPFFYFSGNNDAGDTYNFDITLNPNLWYRFEVSWDIALNRVKGYMVSDEGKTLLVDKPFHISNRFNAKQDGIILGPNVVKITMPYSRLNVGYGFIDNVSVERLED